MKISPHFFRDTYMHLRSRQYGKRELALFFFLAFFVGAGTKAAVTDTLTMGFDDYTLASSHQRYDLNALQREWKGSGSALGASGVDQAGANSCSQ